MPTPHQAHRAVPRGADALPRESNKLWRALGDCGYRAASRNRHWHGALSGPATKVLLTRAWQDFGDRRFIHLTGISISYLDHLRSSAAYQKVTRALDTNAFVTRHDRRQESSCTPRSAGLHPHRFRPSEAYLLRVIGLMLESLHSDGGSECINFETAKMLNKLDVEFIRSRPRHTNGNALVESKNGAIARKIMVYATSLKSTPVQSIASTMKSSILTSISTDLATSRSIPSMPREKSEKPAHKNTSRRRSQD
jgi:hypothetical protein